MKVIRENVPFIIGCFAYYVGLATLNTLIWLGISFLSSQFFSQPSDFVSSLLRFSTQALAGYLSFLVSVKWITSPMLKTANITKMTGGFLFAEWLLFSLLVYIFGNLPLSLLPVLSIVKELQKAIAYTWMAIIGFSFYKGVSAGHTFSLLENNANENDSQAKVV